MTVLQWVRVCGAQSPTKPKLWDKSNKTEGLFGAISFNDLGYEMNKQNKILAF